MVIKINGKTYDSEKWELVDTFDNFAWQEFVYFFETLYRTESGEYVLQSSWQLSPMWAQSGIESGTLTQTDLLPKEEYNIISREEAMAMIDRSEWEV